MEKHISNPKFVGFFNKNPEALNNMFINMIDKCQILIKFKI